MTLGIKFLTQEPFLPPSSHTSVILFSHLLLELLPRNRLGVSVSWPSCLLILHPRLPSHLTLIHSRVLVQRGSHTWNNSDKPAPPGPRVGQLWGHLLSVCWGSLAQLRPHCLQWHLHQWGISDQVFRRFFIFQIPLSSHISWVFYKINYTEQNSQLCPKGEAKQRSKSPTPRNLRDKVIRTSSCSKQSCKKS